jgi:exonuclease SbcC
MQIDTVELKNIGPHKELKVSFEAGVTGIIGSNGAGKSTLVNAIYAGITGDFGRFNAGTKAGVITNTSKKHEPSFVRITGTHDGKLFELKRSLRPNENFFKLGDTIAESATAVNETVLGSLGLTRNVVDQYVFVNQGAMFTFLDESASVRAKTFQHLCGVDFSANISSACSTMLDYYKLKTTVDNSLDIEAQIDSIATQIKSTKEDIAAAKIEVLSAEKLLQLEKAVGDFQRYSYLKLQLATLKKELVSYLAELDTAKGNADDIAARRQKAKDWLSRNIENIQSARSLVASTDTLAKTFSSIIAHKKAKEDAENDLNSFKTKLENLTKEACDNGLLQGSELEEKEAEFRQLQAILSELEVVIKNLKEGKKAECDHCKQKVEPGHIKELISQYNSKVEGYTELKTLVLSSRASVKKLECANTDVVQAEVRLSNVEAKLKALESTVEGKTVSQESLDKAKSILASKAKADKLLVETEYPYNHAVSAVGIHTGNVQSRQSRLTELQEELDGLGKVCSNEQCDEYQQQIEKHKSSKTKIEMLERMLKSYQNTLNGLKATLSSLKANLAKDAKAKHLMSIISRAAEIFHWTCLPKRVAHNNLKRLESHINEELSRFNNPFLVKATEDLSFDVFFSDKHSVSARQLSGGQKVILAIAFRSALDRLFGHNIGIMFLDEPADGLDEDNVAYFHDALQEWSSSMGKNKQIVVITHEKGLTNAFDHIVQISK